MCNIHSNTPSLIPRPVVPSLIPRPSYCEVEVVEDEGLGTAGYTNIHNVMIAESV